MLTQLKQEIKKYPSIAKIAGGAQRELNVFLSKYPLHGTIPILSDETELVVGTHTSLEDYSSTYPLSVILDRDSIERSMFPSTPRSFKLPGYCVLCSQRTTFVCDFAYARNIDGVLHPNWREGLLCATCGFRNRVRGAMHVLFQEYNPPLDGAIYLTEQLTRLYRWVKGRYPNTTGSEYISLSMTSGQVHRGIRHEDLQQLSFDTSSFDYVLSFDVLEHVPDSRSSFREICRILRPGGRLFFTAPMVLTNSSTLERARVSPKGDIIHIEQPEYHGNPSDPANGSLCFRHYGWDVLDVLRLSGFTQAVVHTWWHPTMGYLQHPQYAITALKQ